MVRALVALVAISQLTLDSVVVMAPSPNSSINTPGQVGAVPSPLNPNEEQLYREKYRHLTKYIEPLKRMVARIANDGKDSSKLTKIKLILSAIVQNQPLQTRNF